MFFLIEFDRRGHRLRFFIQLAQLIAYLTFGLERQIRPRADAKRHYRRFLLAENVERRVSGIIRIVVLKGKDTVAVMLREPLGILLEACRICPGEKYRRGDIFHQRTRSSAFFLVAIPGIQGQLVEVLQNDTCRAVLLANRLHLI